MNPKNTRLDDAIEGFDDAGSSLLFREWIEQLSPAARDWLRQDRDREPDTATEQKMLSDRLESIEVMLASLLSREQIKDCYDIEEFARMVGKAEFTCREWCRLGRIRATKKYSGRGKYQAWVVSHEELLRYRKEGLLPLPR